MHARNSHDRNFATGGAQAERKQMLPGELALTLRRAAVLLALVLMASPACAQYQGKPGKPAIADGTCSAEQLAVIDAAFADAGAGIRFTLARLNEDPNHPELRRWFGTTPGKLIRANLERIGERVARGRPADTACNHPVHCRNRPAAYARPYNGSLGFCPFFFNARERGQDSRFGIVVHEVSHIAIGTVDATYQPHQVLVLAKDDPATAARNADNYEYLVETLYR